MTPATPRQAGTDRNQAAGFYRRAHRRARRSATGLNRTHAYAIPTATIPAAAFPTPTGPVTFATRIRVTGATPTGLLFEIGDGTTAIAAWLDSTTLNVRAGDSGGDLATATYTPSGGFTVGLELDLVIAVRPGDGRVRVWNGGTELARDTSANEELPNGWAASSAGAFAAAASGALPADVTQTGAPTNFAAIAPLSVFMGQTPERFA